jgi:hypothetical protein
MILSHDRTSRTITFPELNEQPRGRIEFAIRAGGRAQGNKMRNIRLNRPDLTLHDIYGTNTLKTQNVNAPAHVVYGTNGPNLRSRSVNGRNWHCDGSVTGSAFKIRDCDDSTISGVFSKNSRNGIEMENCSYCVLENFRFELNGAENFGALGISAIGLQNCNIRSGFVSFNPEYRNMTDAVMRRPAGIRCSNSREREMKNTTWRNISVECGTGFGTRYGFFLSSENIFAGLPPPSNVTLEGLNFMVSGAGRAVPVRLNWGEGITVGDVTVSGKIDAMLEIERAVVGASIMLRRNQIPTQRVLNQGRDIVIRIDGVPLEATLP